MSTCVDSDSEHPPSGHPCISEATSEPSILKASEVANVDPEGRISTQEEAETLEAFDVYLGHLGSSHGSWIKRDQVRQPGIGGPNFPQAA